MARSLRKCERRYLSELMDEVRLSEIVNQLAVLCFYRDIALRVTDPEKSKAWGQLATALGKQASRVGGKEEEANL